MHVFMYVCMHVHTRMPCCGVQCFCFRGLGVHVIGRLRGSGHWGLGTLVVKPGTTLVPEPQAQFPDSSHRLKTQAPNSYYSKGPSLYEQGQSVLIC